LTLGLAGFLYNPLANVFGVYEENAQTRTEIYSLGVLALGAGIGLYRNSKKK
jgi:hypothetical protein